MPVKKRAAKGRQHKITPAVVDAFRAMESAEDDDAWWKAHSVLHRALNLPLWEWPAFEYPDAECPYPPGCHAEKHWHRKRAERPHAFELYHALKAAADGEQAG